MKFNLPFLQSFTLAILFVGLYASEHIFPQQNTPLDKKHDFGNVLIGALNLSIVFSGGYFLELLLIVCHAHHFGVLNLFFLPFVLNIILQVILADLVMYWWHRINHLLPILWRFHRFHHTDQKMNTTTTLRFHPVEQVASSMMKLALFPLLGFTTTGVLVYGFLFFPVILVHHSNIKVSEKIDSFYRKVFISPLMHRIHHSKIKMETDSNYGSVFPVWDIIFKSYVKKPRGGIEFGVD